MTVFRKIVLKRVYKNTASHFWWATLTELSVTLMYCLRYLYIRRRFALSGSWFKIVTAHCARVPDITPDVSFSFIVFSELTCTSPQTHKNENHPFEKNLYFYIRCRHSLYTVLKNPRTFNEASRKAKRMNTNMAYSKRTPCAFTLKFFPHYKPFVKTTKDTVLRPVLFNFSYRLTTKPLILAVISVARILAKPHFSVSDESGQTFFQTLLAVYVIGCYGNAVKNITPIKFPPECI